MSKDILIVGNRDTVEGFKSIGQEILFWELNKKEEIVQSLKERINEGVKIIFVTDNVFKEIEDFINSYQENLYPMFVTMPAIGESKDMRSDNIDKLIVQALGTGSTTKE